MVRPVDLISPPGVELKEVDGGLEITRNEGFGPRRATMVLPITREQYDRWAKGGEYVQEACPDLSPEQREFILSGITPERWAEIFSPDPEEEDLP